MKKKFNDKKAAQKKAAAPEKVRLVTIPEHKIKRFDGMSCYEDGMAGKLTYASDAYLDSKYSYETTIPAQTIEFTSWDRLPKGMDAETRQLLKQVMDEEDRQAKILFEQTHLRVMKPLSLKLP